MMLCIIKILAHGTHVARAVIITGHHKKQKLTGITHETYVLFGSGL